MSVPVDSSPLPSAQDGEADFAPVPWVVRHAIVLMALLAVLCAALAIALALARPWLGLRLEVAGDGLRIVHVQPGSPAALAKVPAPATLLALESADGSQVLPVEPSDLIEAPDVLDGYAGWGQFYQRQDRIDALLRADSLVLRVRPASDGASARYVVRPTAGRELANLPAGFWLQVLMSVLGMVAIGWLLSVHPLQTATWFAALCGAMLAPVLMPLAVFSYRELALPSAQIHALLALAHTAGLLAVYGLLGVASRFPQRIAPARNWVLRAAVLACLAAGVADASWRLPSPNWAYRVMMLIGTAALSLQMMRQWRASAGNEKLHAQVRALTWPVGIGMGSFIVLHVLPLLLGLPPLMPRHWVLVAAALVMSVGGVMTLRGLHAYDVDDWALQLLLVWGAGVGALASYQLIGAQGWMSPALAMLAALLVFGVLYVPLVNWAWRRAAERHGPSPSELTSAILILGLAPPPQRPRRWADLLGQTFSARPADWQGASGGQAPDAVRIARGGKALELPAVAGLPAMTLWRRDRGARLFGRSDRRLAQRLVDLARQSIEVHAAYGRGAAEERERIADDLHDDLGAKLLSLSHVGGAGGDGGAVAKLAREALDEMRLAVRNLKEKPAPLDEWLADWRAECVARLQAADIVAEWRAEAADPSIPMPARVSLHFTRVLREAVTNVIKHSGAAHCRIHLSVTAAELRLLVQDDGRGLPAAAGARPNAGQGLANIERRTRRLGGSHRLREAPGGGVALSVQVPLTPAVDEAASRRHEK